MYPIEDVDYKNAMLEFSRRKYKIVIFLLYDLNQLTVKYPEMLSAKFREINARTGNYVAFLTHYDFVSDDIDDTFENNRGYVNFEREEINKAIRKRSPGEPGVCELTDVKNPNPYAGMKNLANIIDPKIINKFPCFVIIDPNNTQACTVQRVKGIKPIKSEVYEILDRLEDADFDIETFSKANETPYYYLSAADVFSYNLMAIHSGINVQLLKDALKGDEARDCFDYDELDKLAKNGYISVKQFLRKMHKIKIRDITSENSVIVSLIDKYLSSLLLSDSSSEADTLFPEIYDFVSPSSRRFLYLVKRFYDGDLSKFGVSQSMTAFYLGKVVEDELNLGIYNAFRGAFSITLPKYYDEVQRNKGKISVPFIKYNKNNRINIEIPFNTGVNIHSSDLKYPDTSDVKTMAFGSNFLPENKSDRFAVEQAKKDINNAILQTYGFIKYDELHNNLNIIARMRNDAVHRTKPLDKDSLQKSLTAFQYLVNVRFFEANNTLKSIERN